MITDFHSHILPEIDDGSRSLEESLEMLREEARQGIQHVVATPHFYPQRDNPERFLERREQAEKRLREAMSQDCSLPRLNVGAEVYFFPGISESEVLSRLTIAKKRYILLEMPQSPWKDSMFRELENIYIKQGLTPIIAHIDRNISPFRTHGIPQRLSDLPVLVQANASFFLNRATAAMALRMLRNEQIQLLGSDCHNMTHRPPRLGEAVSVIRKKFGEEMLVQLKENVDIVFGDNQLTRE